MPDRTTQYFRYLVEAGLVNRYGPLWDLDDERRARITSERDMIEEMGFAGYFVILADIMDYCRRESIPYGPGRGSVGGCLVAYVLGITEVDPLEWGLLFERFLTAERVGYPDIDLDFSQVQRPRVLKYVKDRYTNDETSVLQVAAFARAGARSVIDQMLSAYGQTDPSAGSTAELLRKCLPQHGSITGGQKQDRELAWWLASENKNVPAFKDLAIKAGWLETMLKLDGFKTNLAKHAAGVVILSKKDLANLPRTSQNGVDQMTGYDMYDLDRLKYLKYDFLGLRTLDVLSDADKFSGGDGTTPRLMQIWREHREDPRPYELLQDADTLGIFQMETPGYRRTVRDFKPTKFDHIVQLNALYRPGAIDYIDPDTGKNMVDTFIERVHDPSMVSYAHKSLTPILSETNGVILYQEQAMKIAQELAGFSLNEADALRKAIGKKLQHEMDALKQRFADGCANHGIPITVAERIWTNIDAAARYSWNKSHAVEYGIITWLTAWFKATQPAAFYAALLNSYDEDKDRMAEAVAEARQRVDIHPPEINVAMEGFTVDNGAIVFGLNGIKGMGEANRAAILMERLIDGDYAGFSDFSRRLPSVPINMKVALIRCGSFDATDDRALLLATCIKSGKSEKIWTVAEHINHNRTLKKPREVPPPWECTFPTERQLAELEHEAIGFYISLTPLADVAKALRRLPKSNHFGGEIESIRRKNDKRGQEMADLKVLTPALTKLRVVVFASVWERYKPYLTKGEQLIIRGRLDGDSVLAQDFWQPDDLRHLRQAKISRNGDDPTTELLDGDRAHRLATVTGLEDAGYTVSLL